MCLLQNTLRKSKYWGVIPSLSWRLTVSTWKHLHSKTKMYFNQCQLLRKKKQKTLFPWSLNQTLHSSLLYQWSALHLGRDIFLSLLQKIIMLPDEARSWNSALTLQQLKGTAYRISQHLTVKLYTVLILIFLSIIISITSASRTHGGALRHRNQAVFASRQPHRCETLVVINCDRKYMWAAPPWIIR